jgi:hypothetical protein
VNPPATPDANDAARRRQRAVRRTALFVGLMALAVYVGFIVMTVLER